ncbi:MAG: aquaporin family protein [Devosiaceae bacterium]|nr:aquaporin family protein [Devosiaceae bacterium MH13]
MPAKPPSLTQRLTAEFIGTAFLLATVVGSGIMAEALAGGNVAIALLGNTIPTGAILVVLITMLGPISGAHFNPAVTLVFAIQKAISARDSWLYVAVQIAGGLVGVWAAHLMLAEPVLQASTTERTGGAQWFAEAVATFGLVFTIVVTLKHRESAVPMAVGLYITAAYWFTASTSFANPAVTIARSFSDTFAGIRPVDMPGFIVAQYVGAVIAAIVCHYLVGSRLGSRLGDQSSDD